MTTDNTFMTLALEQAQKAFDASEVPIGAVLVLDNEVIGTGYNRVIELSDATAHAEIQAIRAAGKATQNYRLNNATLYVTLEPCTMCLGAIMHSRLKRVVFGAQEPKAGVIKSHNVWQDSGFFNHTVQWQGGVMAQTCSALITRFFAQRRAAKKALKKAAACSCHQ